jgi:hypothetical protein
MIIQGKCDLIIDGRPREGLTFAAERDGNPLGFGFLSGPSVTLKEAKTANHVQMQIGGNVPIDVTMLQVGEGGVALVTLDVKRIPETTT